MKARNRYLAEYVFLAIVVLLTIAGFWEIYFGAKAAPNLYHLLHITTNFLWLSLLIFQLTLVANNKNAQHRKVGLLVLVIGPLLVASAALLSVHSAHKGVVSGEGDFLIIQNVGVTLELAFVIVMAFVLRRKRKLHASFLLSTGILYMGIALFFSLISFVPMFKIEGPETFYRFQTAAITGQGICLLFGLLFLIKDWRNGWPMLLAGLFFLLNEFVRSTLAKNNLIQPFTEFTGSLNPTFTFLGTFAVLLALLAAFTQPYSPRNSAPTIPATVH